MNKFAPNNQQNYPHSQISNSSLINFSAPTLIGEMESALGPGASVGGGGGRLSSGAGRMLVARCCRRFRCLADLCVYNISISPDPDYFLRCIVEVANANLSKTD
ncbi:hypothetical protein ABFX02_13G140000 [Erythranthe guttata]